MRTSLLPAPLLLAGTAVALVVAMACTSGSNNAASINYSITSCPGNPYPGGAACTRCLESNCSSELDALNGSCGYVVDCVCPAGADAAACSRLLPDGGDTCDVVQGAVSTSVEEDGGLEYTGYAYCSLVSCNAACNSDGG